MYLNQYYTEEKYSDRLVNSLSIRAPNLALDLGFGAGGLLHAARRRWENISLVGIDVDRDNVLNAKRDMVIDAIELNGLSPSLPQVIKDKYGPIDLLVSNPPYYSKDLDFDSRQILKESGLQDCISSRTKRVPAELIFLAQNLRLLSDTGEMGIILPAGLISGEKWKSFREFLFSEYNVSNVIQLPENSFKKTDAQAFILTISKNPSSKINVSHVLKDVDFVINVEEAAFRADFQYYERKIKLENSPSIDVSDFEIFRGRTSHKLLKINCDEFIHTTQMPASPSRKTLPNKPVPGAVNAQAGDILIARVGRRCLGRAMYVDGGALPISDCIIVIRPRCQKVAKSIWNKISAFEGIDYLKHTSLGVGAKYLTHNNIQEFLSNIQE